MLPEFLDATAVTRVERAGPAEQIESCSNSRQPNSAMLSLYKKKNKNHKQNRICSSFPTLNKMQISFFLFFQGIPQTYVKETHGEKNRMLFTRQTKSD
jgi:hypothetical protein